MYGQGMYGGAPMYGMYGFDPRAAAEAARGRAPERETTPVKFTEGKLFIGGVEAQLISKEDLVQYCSQWGEVADAVVMDRKGYGFVTFADPKDAMKFLETRVHELKGRRLDAKAAVPKAHLGTAKLTKKMFVGGTGDLTDDDFREHFSQYGDIEDAAVVRREGMSRGFGFVTFADEISVEKCLLVNHFIKGRKVELKRAVPKEDLGAAGAIPAVGAAALAAPLGAAYPPQQLYPFPYPPAPYAVRPGAYTPSGAGPLQPMPAPMGDPYAAWYGMGYMPYYPSGMYPPPYGMVPQPGVAYGSMPYPAQGLAPGAAAAPVRLTQGTASQEEGASVATPSAAAAAPSGPGRPSAAASAGAGPSSSSAATGSSSEASSGQQQCTPLGPQQQRRVAASPAGTAGNTPPERTAAEGVSARPGSGNGAGQQPPGQPSVVQSPRSVLVTGMGMPGQPVLPVASPAGRRPVVMAYPMVPGVMMRPQPVPVTPRGYMGAAHTAQTTGLTAQQTVPGRLQLPPGFASAQQQQAQPQPQQRSSGAGGGSSTGGAGQSSRGMAGGEQQS